MQRHGAFLWARDFSRNSLLISRCWWSRYEGKNWCRRAECVIILSLCVETRELRVKRHPVRLRGSRRAPSRSWRVRL